MKHFVLIFRSTRAFTPEELERRPLEIAAWVEQVSQMGITLDPRNFGETISPKESIDPALATIVFFDCADRDRAMDIARMHPAPQYGVTVEVREWTPPRGGTVLR